MKMGMNRENKKLKKIGVELKSIGMKLNKFGKELKKMRKVDFFQNLPDELLLLIFSKLTTGFEDIKLLGRCSAVSKRFNKLTCLVPTLSIITPTMDVLFNCCPKILNKFKHIQTLHVHHGSHDFIQHQHQHDRPYAYDTCWKATYNPPHNYRLVALSFTSVTPVRGLQHHQPPYRTTEFEREDRLFDSARLFVSCLFQMHHMLVLCIRNHQLLQRVVITDPGEHGILVIDEEQLLQLRNTSTTITDLEQVRGCRRAGFVPELYLPTFPGLGILMIDVTFSIITKWGGERTHDDNHGNILTSLHFQDHEVVLREALESILRNPTYMIHDHESVPETFSFVISNMVTTV